MEDLVESPSDILMLHGYTCLPQSTWAATAAQYSPGICPDEWSIARITEWAAATPTPGEKRLWEATCCFGDTLTRYMSSGIGGQMLSIISVTLTSGTIHADDLVIYWQETDLPDFPPDYASLLARRLDLDFTASDTALSTVSETATSMSPSESTSTPDIETDTEPDIELALGASRGLSTGAKAGIGIGAVVWAAVFLGAAFLLYKHFLRRKKKLRKEDAVQNDPPELVQNTAAE
ncbi:hypothetical protein DDE82_003113 [Stemphylium lycopersici]|nr:hypothetical protein TW65_98147 [Stemphylium lycopersici]RAR06881.1 hypothetical protein DDE82_003113 [Stemphylium lycopersici]